MSDYRRPREDVETALTRLDRFAWLLDANWRVPFTRIRFGLDPVISLIPGLGDAAAAIIAGYVVWEAGRNGAPAPLLLRMLGNIAIDMVVGSVPVFGTVFDVFYKPSRRNVALLREHLARTETL